LFVPLTLPGERVRMQGSHTEIIAPSVERIAPPCPHFGTCGGCALQHWRDDSYAAWKSGLLQDALLRAGFVEVPMQPIARTPPRSRRRLDFSLRRQRDTIVIGLHEVHADTVVDLHDCHVLHPALFALIGPLRAMFRGLTGLRHEGSLIINMLDAGPDVLLRLDADVSAADRSRLTAFARAHHVPRISVARSMREPETVCLLRQPTVSFAGVPVTPPPGAFLQASAEGEAAIVAAVLNGLPAKGRIAELYSGCGTLTFPLARRTRVAAFEGDTASAAALRSAANAAGLAGRVEVSQRDLVRQRLSANELSAFATVVLDPPHAGAVRQTAEIAASSVRRVIYVSCNPATLERDAGLLRLAGFQILTALPVDQFLWSARLESVVVFGR
jgi:23S rRNA (uracil1939-C5)-methyltransferase